MKLLLSFMAMLSGLAAAEEPADNPMAKVVELLEDLQKDLENDQKVEQEMFDKYACWCEETTDKKAHFITEAREKIKTLQRSILELKGTVAIREAELEELRQKIAEAEEAIESATSVRQKENQAFMAEKVELEQAISALEKAITVLSGAGTFLQGG